MRRLPLLPLLAAAALATGCVRVPALPPASPGAPPFDAVGFFTGHSTGVAELKVLLHRREAVLVESEGRVGDDGTLVLDQTVTQGAKPPHHRRWRIREVSPGHYAGTLTPDATGPVRGLASPGRLRLAYPMKGGLQVEQNLVAAPDGGSAHNVLVVRKYGMVVAAFEEVIRKDD